ncbi:MAG TPA: FHA domain-containing serine/threonine-protein kinase, partial [Aggregatilineales bacterium]|nr:FHA domain-containing serine/threonine-protein kinase [Aggregatilineales bacterium]
MTVRDSLRIIDQYEILEVIGRGGMSTVYKALDTQLQRLVALKLMHAHLTDKPDFRSRFLAEGRAIAALSHPNIIHIYDVALSDGQLYLVMEYVDGGTLRKRLNTSLDAGKLLDLREIVTIGRQVAQALDYAHSQGIVHRDVKPDNVLLKPEADSDHSEPMVYEAVLSDFGLAKRIDAGQSLTATNELIGTLAYMAPERFRGDPLIDGRSDIYSLGVMLYELISGRQPFWSTSMVDMILMHTQGEPERIQDLRPDTPPSLTTIILRTMLKNPDERYETAGELARELEALEKSIKAAKGFAWTVEMQPRRGAARQGGEGAVTVFDILPALDRPAIPVDLFSEGSDDIVIVTPPDGASWSLPVEKPSITIGRDPSCDLLLDDLRVSRFHARVDRLSDGQIVMADLGTTNGIYMGDTKLDRNAITSWVGSQSAKIGPFWLTLRMAKVPRRSVIATQRMVQANIGNQEANVRLLPADSYVEAGSAVFVRIEITNRRDVDQYFSIVLQGLPAEWFTLAPFPLHVLPNKSAERSITLHPPRVPASAGTSYPYVISVTPVNQDRASITLAGTLEIFPFYAFKSYIKSEGEVASITLTNEGNSPRYYTTELRDRSNNLLIAPARVRTLIAPGQDHRHEIRIQPKR